MAHAYMKYQKVDKMHDFFYTNKEVGYPVENWLLREPMTMKNVRGETIEYPKGTWMASLKVTDDETWQKVQDGTYNGNSATYLSRKTAEKLNSAQKGRVLIKDLEEPIPYTISLVPEPCVHDAIFTSVKMNDEPEKAEKAGKKISKQNKSILKKALNLISGLIESDEVNDDGGVSMTEKSEKENKDEYVKKSDLEDLKTEIIESVKADAKPPKKNPEQGGAAPNKCPKCGATVGANDKFCAACGASLSAGKSAPEGEGGASKSLPNHDDGKEAPAFKSVESYMGRTRKGRPLKKEKD